MSTEYITVLNVATVRKSMLSMGNGEVVVSVPDSADEEDWVLGNDGQLAA